MDLEREPAGDGGEGRPSKTVEISTVSQGQAAELLNLSRDSVNKAHHVITEGAAELQEAVSKGEVAVSTAATLTAKYEQVLEWTKAIREEEERRLNETIFEMWLSCNTQEEIANATGLDSKASVNEKIKVLCSESFYGTKANKLSKFELERGEKNEEKSDEYGWKTPLFNIVLDPFAGGGSTIDVCKKRLRRYWVSDRKPIVEREGEIRKLDITVDLPPLHKRRSDYRHVAICGILMVEKRATERPGGEQSWLRKHDRPSIA